VAWLNLPPGSNWVDVGSGTGALSGAILERASPASVVAVEPSAGFRDAARAILRGRAEVLEGDAARIPLSDAAVDVVVSALVLNFVPDPAAALAEMARVAAPGGVVAGYVWDYADGMQMMRVFWDAAAELDPGAKSLHEAVRFPLCRPAPLAELFKAAGLDRVEVAPVDIATPFVDFQDYWQPFLGGQGPAPAYACSLDETPRARLRDRIRERLPVAPDGSIALTARAWAVRGKVSPRPSGP
jgi:SAM-dependent methyltransferase